MLPAPTVTCSYNCLQLFPGQILLQEQMKQVPARSCTSPSSVWSSAGLVTWLICLFQGGGCQGAFRVSEHQWSLFFLPSNVRTKLALSEPPLTSRWAGKGDRKCQSGDQIDRAGAIELSYPGSRLLEIINISMWVIPGPCYLSTASLSTLPASCRLFIELQVV